MVGEVLLFIFSLSAGIWIWYESYKDIWLLPMAIYGGGLALVMAGFTLLDILTKLGWI